jgi:hypothetical protein
MAGRSPVTTPNIAWRGVRYRRNDDRSAVRDQDLILPAERLPSKR